MGALACDGVTSVVFKLFMFYIGKLAVNVYSPLKYIQTSNGKCVSFYHF